MHKIPLFAALLMMACLSACQTAETPLPLDTTVRDGGATALAGSWQATRIIQTYFIDGKPAETQTSISTETYRLRANGSFELTQGDFSIRGSWKMNPATKQLTVLTESGETLQWIIRTDADGHLVFFNTQNTLIGRSLRCLESAVICTKAVS